MSYIRLLTILFFTGFLTLTLGHGCGQFVAESDNFSSLNFEEDSGDITIIPGEKTVATVYSKQFLDNMLSCSGVVTPSMQTKQEYENRRGGLSEYGYATKVTGPGLMAVAAVAGEVCNDLVNKEKALSADSRRIFKEVDFSRTPSSTEIEPAAKRLALSCWQRQMSAEETSMVLDAVSDAGTMSAEQKVVFACTSILASLSGIEM